MRPIGLGIIGCGGIANAHARAYQGLTDLFRIVAVADVDAQAAAQKAAALGGPRVCDDYRALLDDPAVEAVDICLPHHLHAPVAIDAARAGKHILVEKPIATTLDDADRMVAAALEAGVLLMVGHNERFDPQYQAMKAAVERGEIGAVFCARADHNQNLRLPEGHWLRDNAQAGGGVLIGSGIHRIDLLRWIVGEIAEVSQYQIVQPQRLEGEAASVSIFRFATPTPCVGELTSVWAARRFPWYEYLWLYGTSGSIHNVGGVHLDAERRSECDQGYVKLPVDGRDSFTEEIRHFGECIRARIRPLTHGADARRSLEVVLACYQSAETGQPVQLPLSSS